MKKENHAVAGWDSHLDNATYVIELRRKSHKPGFALLIGLCNCTPRCAQKQQESRHCSDRSHEEFIYRQCLDARARAASPQHRSSAGRGSLCWRRLYRKIRNASHLTAESD